MSDDTLRFVDETKQTQDTYSYLKPIGIRKLRKQINTKEFKKNYFVIDTRKEQPLVVHYDPNHVRTPLSAGNPSTSSAPSVQNSSSEIQQHLPSSFINHQHNQQQNMRNHNKSLSFQGGGGGGSSGTSQYNKRVQFRSVQPSQPHHQPFMGKCVVSSNPNNNDMESPMIMTQLNHLNSRRTLSMPEFLAHYSPPSQLIDSDQTSELFMDEQQQFEETNMIMSNHNSYHPSTTTPNSNSSPIYRKSSIDCNQYEQQQMSDPNSFMSFLTPHNSMSPEEETNEQHQDLTRQSIHHQLLNKHFSMNDLGKLSNASAAELGRFYNSTINILETLQMAQSMMMQEDNMQQCISDESSDCQGSVSNVLGNGVSSQNINSQQQQQQQQTQPMEYPDQTLTEDYNLLREDEDELFQSFADYLNDE